MLHLFILPTSLGVHLSPCKDSLTDHDPLRVNRALRGEPLAPSSGVQKAGMLPSPSRLGGSHSKARLPTAGNSASCTNIPDADTRISRPKAKMAKRKLADDVYGVRGKGRMPNKRKAAEASSEKIRRIAEDESHVDKEESDVEKVEEVPIAARPSAKRASTENVDEMPLVAPGLRLWEGFVEDFAGTELGKLAKVSPPAASVDVNEVEVTKTQFDGDEAGDEKALDIQRKYGTSLKPVSPPLPFSVLILLLRAQPARGHGRPSRWPQSPCLRSHRRLPLSRSAA